MKLNRMAKKAIIGAAIITATIVTPVHAEDPAVSVKVCTIISELAEATMSARQAGVDMAVLMATAIEQDEIIVSTNLFLIERAYNQPRYDLKEYRAQATRDFKNKAFLECYKSRRKQ